jgi:hypothetical protein
VRYDSAERVLRFGGTSDEPTVAAARMTLRSGQATEESRAAMAAARAAMPPATAKRMADYDPELPAEHVRTIRTFVEDAVALTLPKTSYSVETLLGPSMHFAYWAVNVVGADLDATIIFNRELIEHYVRQAMPGLEEGTRRNHRAWLFRVAEAVNPEANPRNPMPLNERRLETPYTEDECADLDRWAAGQGTPYMRRGATVLIALGAGAGLTSAEIATLRRESVTVSPDRAVTINVTNEGRVRTVPVAARYEKSLAKSHQGSAGGVARLPSEACEHGERCRQRLRGTILPPGRHSNGPRPSPPQHLARAAPEQPGRCFHPDAGRRLAVFGVHLPAGGLRSAPER